MKKILCLLLFASLTITATMAQTKEEKEVAETVEHLRKALIDPTKANLDKIAAEDLSYGHSSGVIQTKAEFEETLLSGKSDFVSIEFKDQTIKVSGDAAVVRHKLYAQTNDGGKPGNVAIGIMLVFQKQKGEWKLLARQAYKLP
jgi:ketosteroid isomerase-like protein